MSARKISALLLLLLPAALLGAADFSATLSLVYDGNGNSGGIPPFATERLEPGSVATVAPNCNGLERKGFFFVGWDSKADGTGRYYAPGSPCPLESSDLTLYAKWDEETLAAGGPVEVYEQEVERLEALPAPAQGTIAAVGSSTMFYWSNISADLRLPIWNRAFGGSTTGQQLAALARLVLPYRPRIVIYYCGDNDMALADSNPDLPVERFILYAAAIHKALPRARIVYLGIKPSIARWSRWEGAQKVNAAIAAYSAYDPLVRVIDTSKALLGADGCPRPEFYRADRLHLSPAGYAALSEELRPLLQELWEEVQR